MLAANLTQKEPKRTLVIIGLTKKNIDLLQEGKPIIINNEKTPGLLPDGFEIVIFAGETERDLYETSKHLVDPDNKAIIDPKLADEDPFWR